MLINHYDEDVKKVRKKTYNKGSNSYRSLAKIEVIELKIYFKYRM